MVVITATANNSAPAKDHCSVSSSLPSQAFTFKSSISVFWKPSKILSTLTQTPRTGESRRMHTTRTTRSTTWRGNRSCRTSDFWGSLVWWTSQWAARWFERGTRPWWSRLQWSRQDRRVRRERRRCVCNRWWTYRGSVWCDWGDVDAAAAAAAVLHQLSPLHPFAKITKLGDEPLFLSLYITLLSLLQ